MTEEITVTNWKARAAGWLAWAKSHPEVTIPAGTFLLGVIIGWVLG